MKRTKRQKLDYSLSRSSLTDRICNESYTDLPFELWEVILNDVSPKVQSMKDWVHTLCLLGYVCKQFNQVVDSLIVGAYTRREKSVCQTQLYPCSLLKKVDLIQPITELDMSLCETEVNFLIPKLSALTFLHYSCKKGTPLLLRNLSNLNSLIFNSTPRIEEIQNLTNLTSIEVNAPWPLLPTSWRLAEVFDNLTNLTKLSGVPNFKGLSRLTALSSLSVSGSAIPSGLADEDFSQLVNLRSLEMDGGAGAGAGSTKWGFGITQLSNLTRLTITKANISELSKLTTLKTLYCRDTNGLTAHSLSHLTNLVQLSIVNNCPAITPAVIHNLPNLVDYLII